jgi:methionine synthase I (cobalamin-dependent)/5,10-methylenetetrahydrofolate reductase
MGTMLYARGVFVNVCYDELNIKQPNLVRDVHSDYVRAGAEVLETNTFGANPVKLSAYGLADRTEDINRAAARLAREAGEGSSVLGAIGPLGVRIEPFGPTGRPEAVELFRRQAGGLVAGGVDGFVLETFSDLEELKTAYHAVRSVTDLPVVAQMTVGDDGRTVYGTDVETIATVLTELGVDVIGLNCSVGPAVMLDAIERMAAVTDTPLSALPNAGLPRVVGDRKIYFSSPEYMANYAERLIGAGARFVGGCCGTTPDHIRAIRHKVASLAVPRARVSGPHKQPAEADGSRSVPLAERSRWGTRLAQGDFVTTVELLPPKGWQPTRMVEQAKTLKSAGVDAVSIPDGARAQSRMGAIASGLVILREAGMEPLVHYTCRDRNMVGMVSDLLGAAAAGIRNILVITGDPPRLGPYPDATSVFDIDSIGLTNVVHRLNRGLDPGGNSIGEPTRYVIGVAANPWAADLDHELKRLYWKAEAGAEFVITQPVFDVKGLEVFVKRAAPHRLPIIAGIWPLLSLRNAEFLANEVPGIYVPEAVLTRMRVAEEKGEDAAAAEGVAIARETLAAIRKTVRGVQVSAPFGRVDHAVAVLTK